MTIDSSAISVLVQGRFDPQFTPRTIATAVKFLPHAEIVLSTNNDVDQNLLKGLPIDVLVLNENPPTLDHSALWVKTFGADCKRVQGADVTKYTTNRHIASARSGIKAASKPYLLKLRADMELLSTGFLDYFDCYPERSLENQIFSRRIIGVDIFSPERSAFCMYVSDFCSFGTRADILKQWDIPFQPLPVEVASCAYNPLLLIAEQYFWTSVINRSQHVYLPHMYYKDAYFIDLTKRIFANNIISLNFHQFGFAILKYPRQVDWNYTPRTPPWWERITHAEWKLWYKQYCAGPGYDPKLSAEERAVIAEQFEYSERYLKYLAHVGLPPDGRNLDAVFAITQVEKFQEFNGK